MGDVVPLRFSEGALKCSEVGEVPGGREKSVLLGRRARASGKTCASAKGFAHGTGAGMGDGVPLQCRGNALRCKERGEVHGVREEGVLLGRRARASGRTCACVESFAHGTGAGMADGVPLRSFCTGTVPLRAGKQAHCTGLVSR